MIKIDPNYEVKLYSTSEKDVIKWMLEHEQKNLEIPMKTKDDSD